MITTEIPNLKRVIKDLESLVPKHKWIMIWRDLTRYMLSLNRKRIQRQENLDNSRFEGRKDGKKKKMLSKSLRGRLVKIRFHSRGGSLRINNKILILHHEGGEEKIETKLSDEDKKRPCTKKQSIALIELIKGKPKTQKWYMQNYTVAKAGFIIRKLREEQGIKDNPDLVIKYAERHILGLQKQDKILIINRLETLIYKYTKYK